jgi:hypothetical protein
VTNQRSKRKKEMDGAVFSFADENKTPADFMNGPDGKRPGATKEPTGRIKISLKSGIDGRTLPPRFIWDKGEWANDSSNHADWNIWVVSGEGTPGNYEKREYEVPDEIAKQPHPKHPAEWPKKLKDGNSYWSSGYTSGSTKSTSASASLPWGLRIRCTACGHFYKVSDLGDHAKNACPAAQDKPAMWAIQCECHPDDILSAAEVLPGFPIKPPQPKAGVLDAPANEETDEAPDMSGAEQMTSDLQPKEEDLPTSSEVEPGHLEHFKGD